MPDCSENYESEISEGTNLRNVRCKFCNSLILSPSTATFINVEFKLPLMQQSKSKESAPETENTSLFWTVTDIFTFQNIGFSNTVSSTKYLACADCEAGPIGYYDLSTEKSYVALSRVVHS